MIPRSDRDQEDRANIALGALDALHDLLAGQDPLCKIDPGSFIYLFGIVGDACRDAIPNGWPKHGAAVNDDGG